MENNGLKNGGGIQFSFHVRPSSTETDCDEELFNQGSNSARFTEEDFEELIHCSQLWSLHLADVSIKENRIIFKLDQPSAYSSVLKSVLDEQAKFGANITLPQGVKINLNESLVQDLTQFRLRLIKRTADNILNSIRVEDRTNVAEFTLTTKPVESEKKHVLCGVVINAAKGKKETDITPDDYYKTQVNDLRLMSEHRYWEEENEGLLHNVAEASVIMFLVEVNPRHTVSLNLGSSVNKFGGSMSKGAAFILYNYARLASIRKKFQEKCAEGVYPQPPRFEDLDFSLLKEEEEWLILFNYLLEYPTIIRNIAEDLTKGVINTHKICRFLSGLSSLFSIYYRRVRILLEPRKHLLPLIFVRLQLLQAIQQVMQNALSLLDIKTVEDM